MAHRSPSITVSQVERLFCQAMNNSLSLSTPKLDPISNIRLVRMPSRPQPRDKLYQSAGVRFRISERFVYKPRLNAGSPWQLYDGVTIPKKEDLILVGNPNMRSSKVVYILADQAEYRMLDICEIPFVTLVTTRNIISAPTRVRFGQQSNNFQFTFRAQERAGTQVQIRDPTPPDVSTPSSTLAPMVTQTETVSSVAACIAAVTSYFNSTTSEKEGRTAQKRSRETAFEGDQDVEANPRHRPRPRIACNPYGRLLRNASLLASMISMGR